MPVCLPEKLYKVAYIREFCWEYCGTEHKFCMEWNCRILEICPECNYVSWKGLSPVILWVFFFPLWITGMAFCCVWIEILCNCHGSLIFSFTAYIVSLLRSEHSIIMSKEYQHNFFQSLKKISLSTRLHFCDTYSWKECPCIWSMGP